MVRADDEGDPAFAQAHLADPNRLWPSGTVEYRFWKTFPLGDNYPARALRALGLLLADGAPTVGRGKTF